MANALASLNTAYKAIRTDLDWQKNIINKIY